MTKAKKIGDFIYTWGFYNPYNKGGKWRRLEIADKNGNLLGYGYGFSNAEAKQMAFLKLSTKQN